MKEKILEKFTSKRIYITMLIAFLVSLIPIILLATYNFPCGDDFSASDDVRLAWMHTGSIIAVLKAAWDNVVFNFLYWSGVYMSVFWTSLQPGLFGEQYYCITTYITLFMFIISVAYLIHVIFTKYAKADKYTARCVGILYLFTIIQCMPSGNEGLFWHAGTANYCWAFSFLLILQALMLSIYKEIRKKRKVWKCVIACVLSVCVGGGNYITALQGMIWLIITVLAIVIYEKLRTSKRLLEIIKQNLSNLIPPIVILVSFGASVLAPGNTERILESTGMGPIKAVLVSFYYCLDMFVDEWLSWPIIVILILAIPFMWEMTEKQTFGFQYPGLVILMAYALSSAAYTPLLYAQGNLYAERVQNTVFFIEVLMMYISVYYMLGWIRSNIVLKQHENENKKKIWIIGILIFFMFGSAISIKADETCYIASEAMYDIITGRAQSFKEQNEKRLKLYLDDSLKNVVVERFVDPPELLQVEDNTPEPIEWINLVVAKYYEKESVRSEEY